MIVQNLKKPKKTRKICNYFALMEKQTCEAIVGCVRHKYIIIELSS